MPVAATTSQPRRYADSTLSFSSNALQSIRVNDIRLTAEPTALKTVQTTVTDTSHQKHFYTFFVTYADTYFIWHLLYVISVSSIVRCHTSSLRVPPELTFMPALNT